MEKSREEHFQELSDSIDGDYDATVALQAVELVGGGSASFRSANTARVDPSGNDSTGVVGDLLKPFKTVQGAINAIESGSFDSPWIDVGNLILNEDVTTSLVSLSFVGTRIPFNNITFTEPTASIEMTLVNVTVNTGISVATAGGFNISLFNSFGGNISNSEGTLSINSIGGGAVGTVSCPGFGILIVACSNSPADSVNEIDSAGSSVLSVNSIIQTLTAAASITLQDSRIYINNAGITPTYADVLLANPIFPDSDPTIANAGYWLNDILVKSGTTPSGGGLTVWDSGATYHANDLVLSGGGTWKATGTNTNSRPTTQNTNWTLVFANGVIDLGIVESASVQTPGVLTLIPYTAGRLIEEVLFTFDGYVAENTVVSAINFVTPNQSAIGTSAVAQFGNGSILDTKGCRNSSLLNDPSGNTAAQDTSQILDTTPLYAISTASGLCRLTDTWAANKRFDDTGIVILVGGKFRTATSLGGVTGSSEPDWSSPDPISGDGTMNWSAPYDVPTAQIHAFARVIDVPGVSMPIPTSIEWVVQPSDVVAGENITPAPQLRILDQNGDPYLFLPGLQYLLAIFNLGDGTLSGFATGYDAATGVVTYDNLNLTPAASNYILRAEFFGVGVPFVDSDPFDVTP
jgi:hypothetical protein